MQKKLDDSAVTANPRQIGSGPFVGPFHGHGVTPARSRSILIDAAACFIATALGSLSPQALSLLELAPAQQLAASVDPEGGKFTERVLIGGLQSLSWEDSKASLTPAFTTVPTLPGAEEAPAFVSRKTVAAPARPVKEPVVKKPEKAPEAKLAEALPVSLPAPAPRPASETVVTAEPKPEAAEQGVLSALTPSNLSSKVAPVGQKVWSGAKSLGGVVASGLSWIGY